jgi:ribonuclease HI
MALSIMQWNARGLRCNKDQLKHFLLNTPTPPDVLCIEETFLKEKALTPKLENYNSIRKDTTTKGHGGLIIYIKVGLNFNVLEVEEIPNIEIQGVEITTLNGHLKIYNTYIPPEHNITKENLQKLFPNKRAILVGDYNSHNTWWGCTKNNIRGKLIEEILVENNMVVLNTGQATHITSNQSKLNSVIDLSISSLDLALNATHLVTNRNMGSDHYASITTINEEILIEDNISMKLWKLNKANWKNYKELSNFAITKETITGNNIDESFHNIVESLTNLANQSIPCKNSYCKKSTNKNKKFKPLPYWNEKCSNAIYKRNQFRNKMKKSKELHDYLEYKKQEAIVKQTLKAEAKDSWQNYCSEFNDQTKLGAVWNLARKMNGVATYSSIPTLKDNGILAESNKEKANMLANSYANTSNTNNYSDKFLNHLKDNNLETNPQIIGNTTNSEIETLNKIFNINELKEAIRSSKTGKSPGDDKIPYELLKNLHKNAMGTLLSFYNDIWMQGKLPIDWHHAVILPLLKPNKDASVAESYRPISLTPTLCKVMEKMVANRLQWYLETNNLITKNQSGFRKYKSTIDQILKLQDTILKKLKNKESVLAVFIDFERAYDMLHVPTLLRKLQTMGIVGHTTNWIENFLSNRTFQVKVGSEFSNKLIQQNGIPQGSVISPLLFLIMINDIPSGPDNVEMSLFADDSAVYMGCRNIKTLVSKIQMTVDIIYNWCNKNGFKISLNKTTAVLFSKKRHLPIINIKIDQNLIKMENKAKFLGIIFDRKLTWQPHIEYIIERCKKRLNLMRAVSGYQWGASKRSLLTIYKALIRSIIDYGDVAYSTACKSHLNKISVIQTEALRICCGAPKGTSASALQNECGEMPLQLRRTHNSIKVGIKVLSSKNHPCIKVFQQHWTDVYRTPKNINNNQSIYYRTQEFISTLNTKYIGPSFPSFPPWAHNKIKVDISLRKQVNKQLDNPEFLKQATLTQMYKYNNLTHIYTDGSKVDDIVAAAFTIPSLEIDKKFRLCNETTIYAAELTAIKEAVAWILNNEGNEDQQYLIISDSLSVLTSIKLNISKCRPQLFNELVILLNKLDPDKVTMIWSPSHIDLAGNDRADRLAKEGLSLENINSTNYLEIEEMNAKIKPYIIAKWQIEYDNTYRGHFHKGICPTVNTDIKYSDSSRTTEVQISRFRLGVANTNYRLFVMGKHPTGLCDTCQIKGDLEHLLLKCTKDNISTILQNQCLMYKLDFDLKTLLGVGCLQNSLYNAVKLVSKGKLL